MSDNVIFGIDFRKGREPLTDLTQMAADIVSQITEPAEDTAPCEYVAPLDDPA